MYIRNVAQSLYHRSTVGETIIETSCVKLTSNDCCFNNILNEAFAASSRPSQVLQSTCK